jgi:hypothetical protein
VAVKIQSAAQLLGVSPSDVAGRRLGRIAAVLCAPDPYSTAWSVVRVFGWRRLRAVPAAEAEWEARGGVVVPYRRAQLRRSPCLPPAAAAATSVPGDVERFYARTGPARPRRPGEVP